MNRAYIFIGSNVSPQANYLEGLRRVARLGTLKSSSSVYETAPVGEGGASNFHNGAALLETPHGARHLKDALRKIETEMGRVRTDDRNAPRPIDLDLVLYNRDRIEEGDLHVPDHLILERPFLATALAEISPDYIYPGDGRTLAEIARGFGPSPRGMRLDREMTERVRQLTNQIHTGEYSHA